MHLLPLCLVPLNVAGSLTLLCSWQLSINHVTLFIVTKLSHSALSFSSCLSQHFLLSLCSLILFSKRCLYSLPASLPVSYFSYLLHGWRAGDLEVGLGGRRWCGWEDMVYRLFCCCACRTHNLEAQCAACLQRLEQNRRRCRCYLQWDIEEEAEEAV